MSTSMAEMLAPPVEPVSALSEGLRPVEPGYAHVIRLTVLITVLPFVVGAGVLETVTAVKGWMQPGAILVPVLALAAFIVVFLPQRKWRRWGYSGADEQLRVARGWLFRTDTIVPFKRIQHIDVAQGPVERLFGLASLTVHTAGTHNSIVTLPGLTRDDAEVMRDAMRLHIRREAE
ncbi:PH domain-containing protein [Blastomonas sp.]|uniref:PH domain-containing protein n=1 Tax=Blastomonas sp. TaxID=1909299 RepID=UPI00260AEE59|nr:PH domain-containing protein [Blastomonas sp.]MDM7955478.1 PH domain-containing protein [Blastomonas sp.]